MIYKYNTNNNVFVCQYCVTKYIAFIIGRIQVQSYNKKTTFANWQHQSLERELSSEIAIIQTVEFSLFRHSRATVFPDCRLRCKINPSPWREGVSGKGDKFATSCSKRLP